MPLRWSELPPGPTAESTGETGLFNSALAIAAEYSDTARAGRQLIAQFQSLGLGVDMIPLFTNVVGDYLKQTGNAEAGNLLITVLAAIL